MGNKTFKDFEQKPIGKGCMNGNETYLLSNVLDTEMSFLYKARMKTSELIHAETNEVIYKGKHTLTGKKSLIFDKDDNILCVYTSKTGFKTNKMWIYKTTPTYSGQPAAEELIEKGNNTPIYLVARMVAEVTMTTAKGSVEVVVGEDKDDKSGFKYEPILTSFKISTMGFNAYVEDVNGECVAKCTPKAKMSFDPKVIVAAGVDPLYVFTAIMLCAPGGGGSAGALAGAGVV